MCVRMYGLGMFITLAEIIAKNNNTFWQSTNIVNIKMNSIMTTVSGCVSVSTIDRQS